jgi:tetratricopeptide (TPR) repeat protein
VAAEADTTVLVVGGTVGKAFAPSPWEAWLEARPSYDAGDYEAAAAVLESALAAYPGNAHVLYNLACCEALVGRREDALGHLRRAAELDPRVGEWAANDLDLDSIRDAL